MRVFAGFAVARLASATFAFELAPAKLCPDQAVYNTSMSAWGGSVVEITTDPVWRYHMYNGIYTKGCGVNYWRGNSAVAHLGSKTPEGPFVYLDEALPLWHTNPQVVVDPTDGTLVLFAIGQSVNQSNWTECNCSAPVPCPPGPPNPTLAGLIDVHFASSPYGPWQPLVINGSTVAMHGTNPTPFFYENGTLVLGINAEGTHVAVMDDWRTGPYVSNPTNLLPNNNRYGDPFMWAGRLSDSSNLLPNNNSAEWYEDPFIWAAGGRWRQLVHQYPVQNGRPAHQFATGGYGENVDETDVFAPWAFGGLADPAYTNNVTYVDGSVQTLSRRERPKLIFASDGRVFLYNAVQSPLNASRDFSYTLVQEVLSLPP